MGHDIVQCVSWKTIEAMAEENQGNLKESAFSVGKSSQTAGENAGDGEVHG
jgi:hypothetical protein